MTEPEVAFFDEDDIVELNMANGYNEASSYVVFLLFFELGVLMCIYYYYAMVLA